MTTKTELKVYCNQVIKKYPSLKNDILSLYNLCLDEIAEGGSETHEVDLCECDILSLIDDYER